ncbi:MAG: hypothetical protein NVSMB6_20850 [Burkholderiaceae bacterium]
MTWPQLPVIRPVILSGGAGTRLWPVSRPEMPKQFLQLMGDRSLLRQTLDRATGEPFSSAIIVSGEDQAFLVAEQLEDADASVPEAVLLEPVARNTAAAAALAAAWLMSKGRDDLLLLMPADHLIADRDAFLAAIEKAIPHAEAGAIVTFGAEPTEPNTQYGYIEARADGEIPEGVFNIARFHEKPDAALANKYIQGGRFFWNCGIFLVKSSSLLAEMRLFLPRSLDAITKSIADASADELFIRPSAVSFADAENISIDHGIMEKTDRGVVVPVHMKWSDVGAWDSVWRLGCKDRNGNVTSGDVVMLDSRNSLLRSDGKARIAAIGLDNICVVAVDGAILVASMDRVAEVKDLLAKVRTQKVDVVEPNRVKRILPPRSCDG